MEITTGKVKKNMLVAVYGPESVGKTTFAAGFPSPVFLGAESGTSTMDVARTPEFKTYEEFLGQVDWLINNDHPYKTFVLDSLDWLEPYLFFHLTQGKMPIEEIAGGYGKYVGVINGHYSSLMTKLSTLRKKMHIVIIAHAQMKKFSDPVHNEAYDRYTLKLYSEKSSQLWKEYFECLLFMNFEIVVSKDRNGKIKTYGDGIRKLYTEHRPSFDAKNRCSLPFEMESDSISFISKYMEAYGEDEMPNLIAQLKTVDLEKGSQAEAFYLENKMDSGKMLALRNKIRALL